MTHKTQNVTCEHAMATRTVLEAFRRQQPEAGLDWSSFDTAVALLDQTIEELRRSVRSLPPTQLAAGGFPAAMAYLIEEIQTAAGPAMEFCHRAIDADVPPKWKQAAIRITQESLANACRHSKSKRLFLELILDGDVLRIHARDWGVGFKSDKNVPSRCGQSRTCRPLKLLGGTATIDCEPGKGTYVIAEIPVLKGDRRAGFVPGDLRRLG